MDRKLTNGIKTTSLRPAVLDLAQNLLYAHLAVTATERSSVILDLPTTVEQGVPVGAGGQLVRHVRSTMTPRKIVARLKT